ncbi:hypothetical protein ACSDR0_14770 [Streptosporangium sp. G11]|uniref:hypothetical protein n=1 Tax=Streptosporangium sp. G11 TaxID=3436926 RepID=UPI003EBDA283
MVVKIFLHARFVVIGVAVIVILLPFSGRLFGPWKEYSNNDRARLVVVNAFAVSHPGHYVAFEDLRGEDVNVRPDGGSVSVVLSPRSPYMNGTVQGHGYRTGVELLPSGEVDLPRLVDTGATRALDALGEEAETDVESAAATLSGIEGPVVVTALVWLARPLSEDAARKSWRNGFDTVFLGPLDAETSPVSWSPSACAWRGIGDCDAEMMRSPVRQFQRWVSLLEENDAPSLRQLNLDLQEVRTRAQEGLVHGYLVTGRSEELTKLSKDHNIRQMQIVDVVFDS